MNYTTLKIRNRIKRDYDELAKHVNLINSKICALSGLTVPTIDKLLQNKFKVARIDTLTRFTYALNEINKEMKVLDEVYTIKRRREDDKFEKL